MKQHGSIGLVKVGWCCVLACLLSASLPVMGQERTGVLTGVVTDASKGVVGNAAVTITNKSTLQSFRSSTSPFGTYIVRDLSPGHYSIQFEATGFATSEVPDVIVMVGKTLRVSVAMSVGRVEQTIEVTEAAPVIDLTGAIVAHNVTSEEFTRLPKTRSFQDLAITSTSVQTGQVEGGYQVNGSSSAENNFIIDGISTSSLINGRSRQDANYEYLQEVQIKTAGIGAEYGGALGGVINATTKSGGNEFHGDIHYYFGGNKLSSGPVERLVLDPSDQMSVRYVQDGKQKDDLHEFGGAVGGYLIKNRLYFYTAISPTWQRRSNDYLFGNGTDPGTLDNKRLFMSTFNKLSFDPTSRIRTNFSWLYTPTYSTGSVMRYNGSHGDYSTSSRAAAEVGKQVGYLIPQSSYSGNVDVRLTNASLLSIHGGYYYDNYRATGVPRTVAAMYYTSATDLPFEIPASLQQSAYYFNTPPTQLVDHDLTTRAMVQADYSLLARAGGTHNLRMGVGTQKTVNNVLNTYPGGFVGIVWDRAFQGSRGAYGYYMVYDIGTTGSAGANLTNMYVTDQWRIHPLVTLSLGLRTERETIPSFLRDVQEYAVRFNFLDKLAPRLGASFDVLGDGRLKVFGSWGRFYDWTKYDMVRGLFGGETYKAYYRGLDTLDVFSLSLADMPGENLWPYSDYLDYRPPSFDVVDPDLKPMSSDILSFGFEYEVRPQTVMSARYIHNKLNRTIEDIAGLDAAHNPVYMLANPGEGTAKMMPISSATPSFPTPKAKRIYDALEVSVTRRFSRGWFANASYVYSRLFGNYTGLLNTDEIRPPTLGGGFNAPQQQTTEMLRQSVNATRAWDYDELLWTSHGESGVYGRLPTDRPHLFKFYGSYTLPSGTEVGPFFYAGSGTPVSTAVFTVNNSPVLVNGRGDLGRTPFLTQTNLLVSHEFQMGEIKRLRLEFNMLNVFNQKTSQFVFDRLNREDNPGTTGINLNSTDLSRGYDYMQLLGASSAGLSGALDPRYGMEDAFSPGFSGRLMIKFIF